MFLIHHLSEELFSARFKHAEHVNVLMADFAVGDQSRRSEPSELALSSASDRGLDVCQSGGDVDRGIARNGLTRNEDLDIHSVKEGT